MSAPKSRRRQRPSQVFSQLRGVRLIYAILDALPVGSGVSVGSIEPSKAGAQRATGLQIYNSGNVREHARINLAFEGRGDVFNDVLRELRTGSQFDAFWDGTWHERGHPPAPLPPAPSIILGPGQSTPSRILVPDKRLIVPE